MSFVEVLRQRALERPAERAYLFLEDGEVEAAALTYGDLDRRARAVAAALQRTAAPGERALLLFPPGLEFIEAFLGCLYAGVIAVPASPPNPKRVPVRLHAMFQDAEPRLALTTSTLASRLAVASQELSSRSPLRWLATDSLESELAEEWRAPALTGEEVAFLQYTSGSTAAPKGVRVTHRNLLHNEEAIRRGFRQSEESVIVGWLPLYHDMGLIGNVLQPLYVGAPCVLMSPLAFLQKPLRWLQAVSRYRATTSGGPNFAYELCANRIDPEEHGELDLSSWIVAFNGAEPVRAATLDRFAAAFAECGFRREAFYPCYGLAEATLFVTGGTPGALPRVEPFQRTALERGEVSPAAAAVDEPFPRRLVGCGRPWMEQRVAIVDPETLEERPPDRIGEIWVSGPSLARGYWNRPEESRLTFEARLADGGPDRFLRTGDLGFLRDGELFVAGRLKDLIIIRGRNHYPQDIELTVEQSHSALRLGCGAAFSVSLDDEETLIVVQEVDRRPDLDLQAVADAVRQRVAEEHEVIVREVVLVRAGCVPKTSSGKIQRRACREAYLADSLVVVARSKVSPSSAAPEALGDGIDREVLRRLAPAEARAVLESHLRRRIAGLLRTDPGRLRPDQPLASLNLDSLLALELKNALESDLGSPLPMRSFLEDPTWGSLAAALLESLEAGAASADAAPIAAGELSGSSPLSYNQKSLWFVEWLTPDNRANHIVAAARVLSGLDIDRLQRCFQALADRHPSLRTRFVTLDGEPEQQVEPAMRVDFQCVEAPDPGEPAGMERLCREAYAAFDLAAGPLLRVRVFTHGPGGRTLLLALHHTVADFWSLVVLLRELGELYRVGSGEGLGVLPPAPAFTYADFVSWQRRRLEGLEGERLWSFWRERLAGPLPLLNLPTDRPRPPVRGYRGASETVCLSAAAMDRVRAEGHRRGITLFTALLATFDLLLHRYTSQEDLLVGSLAAGRGGSAMSGVVGYFVNPIVLRADLSGDPAFATVLARVRERVLEALEHQDFPFLLLTERLQPRRDPSRTPLFQAMLLLQKAHLPGLEGLSAFALGEAGAWAEIGGLELESVKLAQRAARFDLLVMAAERGGDLLASFEYNADLFDAVTIARMAGHFRVLVEQGFGDPHREISLLPLWTAPERHQLLSEWNDRGTAYYREVCLHHLIERQAQANPTAPAVVCEGDRITYSELDRRACQIARSLRSLGVGPEVRVAICAERSVELIVGLLGILKSGGAYLPLDPDYPEDRIAFILEDGEARVLLTQRHLLDRLPEPGPPKILLDTALDGAGEIELDDPAGGMSPDHLAYVIYTSGSTGRPKGVQVTHRNAVHLVETAGPLFGSHEREVWTVFHSAAFDFSVWEIWPPLARGATLVVVPMWRAQSPAAFCELLRNERVTVLHQTPSAIRQLLQTPNNGPLHMRVIGCGGEAFPYELTRPLLDLGVPVWNFYGPTEATVWCSVEPVRSAGDEVRPDAIPIGRPLPDARLHVMDSHLQRLPQAIPGELFIGGAGVSRGYHRRADLTALSFVPDPFSTTPGDRLYRTGDLVRALPDGRIEFLGRIDHQVKIRGYRIELKEIEVVLSEHPAVRQAVVEMRRDRPGDPELVAYLIAEGPVAAADLTSFLKQRLPQYMVPRIYVPLDRLPLTPNGKVDRLSLPAPDRGQLLCESSVDIVRTPVEEVVAGIWAQVLRLPEVGIHQNFFDLGGHSLLATMLVLRIQEALQVDLAVHELFEAPTVAELSARVEEAMRGQRTRRLPPISRAAREGSLPLSFAQQRLWFSDRLHGGDGSYNIPGGARLRGCLSLTVLEKSLNEIVRRHEILRTSYPAVEGRPVQRIAPVRRLRLPLIDLSALPQVRRSEEEQRLVRAEARARFDLARDLLLRPSLLRLGEDEHLLLITMHHIIADLWSLRVLIREIAALYQAFSSGRPSPLSDLPVQYADFAQWQRVWLQGEALEDQLAFWRRRLAELPELRLPSDRPRRQLYDFWGSARPFRLPRPLVMDLIRLGRRQGATLFMTLLAAVDVLLSFHSRQDDIVVGTNVAGRNSLATEDLIGLFVNQLVLWNDLSGDPPFRDLLRRVRRVVLDAYLHQDLPFDRLVEELNPDRDPSRPLLFQVKVELESNPPRAPEVPGLVFELLAVDRSVVRYDLHFYMERVDDGIEGWLLYKPELFDEARIDRWLSQYEALLAKVVAEPDARLSLLHGFMAATEKQLQHRDKEQYQDALSLKLGSARRRAVSS